LTKETKQEHDFAGLIWFTRKQNQYPDLPGTLTNELPKTKHSLNIYMNPAKSCQHMEESTNS